MNIDDRFDPAAYRALNQDLRSLGLDDEGLRKHFTENGYREKRPFYAEAVSSANFSMKYLRGYGVEIGAGAEPVAIYGKTSIEYADIGETTLFDRNNGVVNRFVFDLNGRGKIDTHLISKYDFAIAQHVLEHCDSLVRALFNMQQIITREGYVYISLPNISSDNDSRWMSKYGIMHHIIEWHLPNIFQKKHEKKFLEFVQKNVDDISVKRMIPGELNDVAKHGRMLPEFSYIHHRHTYTYEGWLEIFLKILKIKHINLRLVDSGVGFDRNDCHFVFEKIK